MRDPRHKGHKVAVLTPEEQAGIRMFMKIQMEKEQQQEISRRAAEEARERMFREREEANKKALAALEERKKQEAELARKKKEEWEAMEAAERMKVEKEERKKALMKLLKDRQDAEFNHKLSQIAAIKTAKTLIPLHPEYKKMSFACQKFVSKLGNDPREILESMDKGPDFRLKMEKECRVTC